MSIDKFLADWKTKLLQLRVRASNATSPFDVLRFDPKDLTSICNNSDRLVKMVEVADKALARLPCSCSVGAFAGEDCLRCEARVAIRRLAAEAAP